MLPPFSELMYRSFLYFFPETSTLPIVINAFSSKSFTIFLNFEISSLNTILYHTYYYFIIFNFYPLHLHLAAVQYE